MSGGRKGENLITTNNSLALLKQNHSNSASNFPPSLVIGGPIFFLDSLPFRYVTFCNKNKLPLWKKKSTTPIKDPSHLSLQMVPTKGWMGHPLLETMIATVPRFHLFSKQYNWLSSINTSYKKVQLSIWLYFFSGVCMSRFISSKLSEGL